MNLAVLALHQRLTIRRRAWRQDHRRPGAPVEREAAPGGFTALRLIAALMVFHSHIGLLRTGHEPVLPWIGDSLGHTAVMMFFAISGYLVGLSALRGDPIAYVTSRALRIQPALLAATCVVTVGLYPFSGLPAAAYWHDPRTRDFLGSAFIWLQTTQNRLPAVFDGLRVQTVNGSLWTLPYEVLCYMALLIASLFGRFAIRLAGAMAGFALVFAAISGGRDRFVVQALSQYDSFYLAIFAGVFGIGVSLCATGRAQHGRVMMACLCLALLSFRGGWLRMVGWDGFLACATVYLGRFAALDRALPPHADISYGIYIYAFPATQLAIRLVGASGSEAVACYAFALCLTLVLAVLSWRLVERPALARKAAMASGLKRAAGWVAL